MKKTYTIVMMVVACAALIPTLVIAKDMFQMEPVNNEEYIDPVDVSFDDLDTVLLEDIDDDLPVTTTEDSSEDDETADEPYCNGKRYLKLRGKWGNGSDPEFDGYWGGRITYKSGPRGNHVSIFKGLYNKTGEEPAGRIVGILKKGYFCGKIIDENGSSCKVTGLYRFDRENQLFQMQWMVPRHGGWAVARIQVVEE